MKAYLTQLGPCAWADLARIDVDEWLWLDTVAPGIHVVNALPARPADVTHVWGWSRERWVRARVDPDLPGGGVVGAVLSRHDDGTGVEQEFVEHQAPIWSAGDGRVARARQPGALDEATGAGGPARHALLRTVTIPSVTAAEMSFAPLTFVELTT